MKIQNNMSEDIATFYDTKAVEFYGQLFVDGQTEVKGLLFVNRISSRAGEPEVIIDDNMAITGVLLVDAIRSSEAPLWALDDNDNGTGDLTGKKIRITGASGGGNIRSIPATDNTESSIGFCNYQDQRAAAAGELWVAGQTCLGRSGFSIDTPIKNAALAIDSHGYISCPYKLTVAGNIAAAKLNQYWGAGTVDGNGNMSS